MRPYQFGDIGQRLSKALGLQGRDAYGVEEGIIPVVIASDAHELPFSIEPRSMLGFGDVTGAAGQVGTLGLSLTGSGKLWVRQLIVTRAVAGRVEVNRSGKLEPTGTFTDRVPVDLSSSNAPNQGPQFMPMVVRQWTTPPVAIGSGIAAQFALAANTALVWPLDVVLSTGEALYVKSLTVADQITCAFHGLYYPSL